MRSGEEITEEAARAIAGSELREIEVLRDPEDFLLLNTLREDTTNSHAVTMNQMWVQQDDWIDTLMWQEEDAREELAGPTDPLNADSERNVLGNMDKAWFSIDSLYLLLKH